MAEVEESSAPRRGRSMGGRGVLTLPEKGDEGEDTLFPLALFSPPGPGHHLIFFSDD